MIDPQSIQATIRKAHRYRDSADALCAEIGLRRLHGGLNNTVYVSTEAHQHICIKVYLVDDRRRAEREWSALQFLAAHQPGLAPEPLWFVPDPEFPIVSMSFVAGQPLHPAQVPAQALHALTHALQQLYALQSPVHTYPYRRVGAAAECVRRIENWAAALGESGDDMLVEYAQPVIHQWLDSSDRELLQEPAQAVFARGDPNLANCLWDGTRVRLIDLEYAGWSDIAFELADLVEHINARSISDDNWAGFVAHFITPRSSMYKRFRAAQRTCALLWILLLWQDRVARLPTLLAQIERVKDLQEQL
jgi:hypothetical protein